MMKLNGKELKQRNRVEVFIPRGNDEPIILYAEAVDLDDFRKLCPAPVAPKIMRRGMSAPVEDLEDEGYKTECREYGTKRIAWMVVNSLRATPGLEWQRVVLNDPNTWNLYEQELKDSGFCEFEVNRIISACMEANSLDEKKIEEARLRFLVYQELALQRKLSSPASEPSNTPSGEPANVSASAPQA